jgi:hypothetical protein
MPKKKQLESANICTVVSFVTSLRCELKIAMAYTVGSMVTLTALGVGRRGGTTFTPSQTLKKMLGTSGTRATEVSIMTGESNA